MALCCQRDPSGAVNVNGAIFLRRCLGENANEVDDRIRSRNRSADSDVVKYIGLDELRSVARCTRHLNTTGLAYDHAHGRATAEKQRHEMAADEAGSAEHRDRASHH
jgi:hypothetical protein